MRERLPLILILLSAAWLSSKAPSVALPQSLAVRLSHFPYTPIMSNCQPPALSFTPLRQPRYEISLIAYLDFGRLFQSLVRVLDLFHGGFVRQRAEVAPVLLSFGTFCLRPGALLLRAGFSRFGLGRRGYSRLHVLFPPGSFSPDPVFLVKAVEAALLLPYSVRDQPDFILVVHFPLLFLPEYGDDRLCLT